MYIVFIVSDYSGCDVCCIGLPLRCMLYWITVGVMYIVLDYCCDVYCIGIVLDYSRCDVYCIGLQYDDAPACVKD